MRAKKALSLPRPDELKSNSVGDIKEYLRKFREELDKQWRLLTQDISTIQVDSSGWIYFGGKDTDGTYRIGRLGNKWKVQRRESGTYISKFGVSP